MFDRREFLQLLLHSPLLPLLPEPTMFDRREFLQTSSQMVGAAMLAGTVSAAEPADGPAYLPASELLARFRERRLSPVAVLEAQIQRIESLNDKVKCITYKHFDEARKAAQASEARYKEGNPRPLEGITVAVKDDCEVKGWVMTMGSLLRKDAPPDRQDGAFIDLLRQAGAVLHIQTTTPEFYIWMTTVTRLWGVTRNPWNLAYSPGGSSGGSGVALAAGFTTLATGSDMGGSIRIPSALCGLYGFKAPFGRIATSEVAFESYGPMARTFDDMNLMTQVVVGPHPLAHASLRPRLEFPAHYAPVKGWKVAFDPMPGLTELDPSVRQALDKAVRLLKGLGVMVEPVDIGFKSADMDTFGAALFSTTTGALVGQALQDPEKIMPYTRYQLERVKGRTGSSALAACDTLAASYHRQVQQQVFTRGYRALLMPTLATPYVPAEHGLKPEQDTVRINGKSVTGLNWALTWVWNLLNRYPVVAAPIGIGPNGVPLGMQIIANTFDDLSAFQLAASYARVAPPLYAGKLFPDFRDQPAK